MKRKILLILALSSISYLSHTNNLPILNNIQTDFIKKKIDTLVKFNTMQIDTEVNFSETQFDSIVNFNNIQFNSPVVFFCSIFNSPAYFCGTKFNSPAYFCGTEFNSIISFMFTQFRSLADFNGATFNTEAHFGWTEFDSIADFSRAKFNSGATFFEMPKYLDFSGIKINNDEIDLFNIEIDSSQGYCLINLTGADIHKIKLQYTRFKLHFSKNTNWEEKENTYEQLLLKIKKEAFIKSYEKLDKEYQKMKYMEGYSKPKYLLNFIQKYWWDYGYKKELIIRNTLYLFIFFTIMNAFLISYLVNNIYIIEKIKNSIINQPKNLFLKMLIRFYYSFIYSILIFFCIKFTVDNLNYSGNLTFSKILGLFYFITIYLSGLICLGYLANYIISI